MGDYGAIHERTGPDTTVFERKSVADLWTSFTGDNYLREKEKIKRAKDMALNYILAVEATPWEIRGGHEYFSEGEIKTSKKDGLTMLRQLCTVERKYGITIKFFNGRRDMAFYIVEFFLSLERIKPE